MNKGRYNLLIGGLLWVSQCTQPDVSFAVNRLSQFLKCTDNSHFRAGLHVLAYLWSTQDLGLVLDGSSGGLKGHTNSDWAENLHDRTSTSGYLFRLGDGMISWKSRKQRTTALSSPEAEYMALSDAGREAMWLRQLLQEICFLPQSAPTPLYYDNTGSAALARNPAHHARSKHIDIRFHFIRGLVKKGQVALNHVPTTEQLADCLTKPLAKPLYQHFRAKMGLVPCPDGAAGPRK